MVLKGVARKLEIALPTPTTTRTPPVSVKR